MHLVAVVDRLSTTKFEIEERVGFDIVSNDEKC